MLVAAEPKNVTVQEPSCRQYDITPTLSKGVVVISCHGRAGEKKIFTRISGGCENRGPYVEAPNSEHVPFNEHSSEKCKFHLQIKIDVCQGRLAQGFIVRPILAESDHRN